MNGFGWRRAANDPDISPAPRTTPNVRLFMVANSLPGHTRTICYRPENERVISNWQAFLHYPDKPDTPGHFLDLSGVHLLDPPRTTPDTPLYRVFGLSGVRVHCPLEARRKETVVTPITRGASLCIETVREVIRLSQADQRSRQDSRRKHGLGQPPGSLRIMSVAELLQYPEDRTREFAALWKLVRRLSHEQRCELEALTWLGRGDSSSWAELVKHAQSFGDSPDAATSYICGKPLHDYLPRGLSLV